MGRLLHPAQAHQLEEYFMRDEILQLLRLDPRRELTMEQIMDELVSEGVDIPHPNIMSRYTRSLRKSGTIIKIGKGCGPHIRYRLRGVAEPRENVTKKYQRGFRIKRRPAEIIR